VSDAAFRNLLGAMSFLLAALSFLANERRTAVEDLRRSNRVSRWERGLAIGTVGLVFFAALCLVAVAVPALCATSLGVGDLLRLDSSIREAFVLGWLLLVAITVALFALLLRAFGIKT
jgi:uncharacterized BrkB/YihY/UPF0761 family membrane protein